MHSRWMVVFLKEFREVLRDGRTRFNMIISPLLITPLILAMIGQVASGQQKKAMTEKVTVGLIGAETAPKTLQTLIKPDNIVFERLTQSVAEAKIKERKIKAAVVLPEDADTRLTDGRPVKVTLLVDEGSQSSQEAGERLKALFTESGQKVVAERLRDNALSIELAIPFETVKKPIPGGGKAGLLFLTTFLPYILALTTIMGGMYAANDSVAGEKERGTLETLLVSPASRRDLVIGKFAAVAGTALFSSILSVIGILWPFYVKLPMFAWLAKDGLTLGPMAALAIFLVQIPLAVLGAGVLLAISTFARNQKEAQSYLAPVILVATVLAMLSLFLKAESGWYYALAPILNAALVLKGALDNTITAGFVAVAVIASLVYAGLALVFAIRLFEQESVLLKS